MGLLIMENYLAIIRKLDFIDLFKYGQFYISSAIPFDGDIETHTDDIELFNMLTAKMNMYEYSFEYLIIHFKANENNEHSILIDIRNVCALYTFDQDAKREMSISFDPRIQLHISPWSTEFRKLQQRLYIKQSKKGIDNLWTIFNLPKEDLDKCRDIITSEIVQEVFRELYNNERPSGAQSIWTYLLRYERHSFYPKGMKGYFCDFIHIYLNFLEQKELSGDAAESTELFRSITEHNDNEPKFHMLIDIVKSSPLYNKTEKATNCRFAIAAPLFLFLKAKFANGIEHIPDQDFINYAKQVGGFECSIAIYLLGLSLGYDKTYDAFYESAKLPFFKTDSITEEPTKANPLFPPEDNKNPEDATQIWMRKGKDICSVYESDLSEFLTKGYKFVKNFNNPDVVEVITSYGLDPKEEELRCKKFLKNRKKSQNK